MVHRSETKAQMLYKYLGVDGARKTLAGRSFKLSAPANFNDPFDIYLDEPLGLGTAEFTAQLRAGMIEFFMGDIDYQSLREGPNKNRIIQIHQALKNGSNDQREKFRTESTQTPLEEMYNFAQLERNNRAVVTTIQNNYNRYGVLCMSDDPANLLMWAHYAEHHRGAVFAFKPSLERDSALLRARPVTYSADRPLLYRSADDLLRRGLLMTAIESAREITDQLVYTKGLDWSYEKERRLYIPDFVEPEKGYEYLDFHPEELSAVYFGCRSPPEQRIELGSLARQLNRDVDLFEILTDRREYILDAQPFSL